MPADLYLAQSKACEDTLAITVDARRRLTHRDECEMWLALARRVLAQDVPTQTNERLEGEATDRPAESRS